METIEFKAPIYKFRVEQHESKKQEILNAIDSMGIHSCHEYHPVSNQKISNTDYFLQRDKPYADLVGEILSPSFKELGEKNGVELDLSIPWFQQYERGDEHGFHDHPHSQWSSVYYLELPNGAQTRFQDHNGNEFTIDVTEGDYVVFPSILFHRSPPNQHDERKTIIAININHRSF